MLLAERERNREGTQMIKLRKSIVAATAVGTVVLGGGAAYAFVVAIGHGKSTANVATPAFTMIVTPAGISGLLPGAEASALPVTVANTSRSSIQINRIKFSIPEAEACGGTITVRQPMITPIVLAAGASTTFTGATLAMADSAPVDQTTCMGSTVTIDASVNGG